MESSSAYQPQQSRRDRERAFRTRLIVEAAESVFVARGFQAASVEEIAARSEVAIATLYKLFGSKEAIFAALVEHRQDELLSEVEAAAHQGSSLPLQVERLVDGVFRYFDRHRDAFRIYLLATHGFPWHIRASLGERAFAKYQAFVGFVADLLRAGAPAEDPTRLAVAAIGALNGLLTHRHTAGAPAALEDDIEQACRVILRLLTGAHAKALSRPRARMGARRR